MKTVEDFSITVTEDEGRPALQAVSVSDDGTRSYHGRGPTAVAAIHHALIQVWDEGRYNHGSLTMRPDFWSSVLSLQSSSPGPSVATLILR